MCFASVAIGSCDAILPPFFQGCSIHHDNRPEQDLCEKRSWSTHVFFTAVKRIGNPKSWICIICLHLKNWVALNFNMDFNFGLSYLIIVDLIIFQHGRCEKRRQKTPCELGSGARVTSVGVTARTWVNPLGKSRGKSMAFNMFYPLVNIQKTMENHHF